MSGSTTTLSSEDKILYHMCQKSLWDTAVSSGDAYYPPTFEIDGYFTHATAFPGRLLETANHFYTKSEGDWICVSLSQLSLYKVGIVTKYEEPKAVGATETNHRWDKEWKCPHIYGGIPHQISGVWIQTYNMIRNNVTGHFESIEGLEC